MRGAPIIEIELPKKKVKRASYYQLALLQVLFGIQKVLTEITTFVNSPSKASTNSYKNITGIRRSLFLFIASCSLLQAVR